MSGILYQRASYTPILESMEANARQRPRQVCHWATMCQETFWVHIFEMWKKSVETVKNPQTSYSELVSEWFWALPATSYGLSSFFKEFFQKELKVHHDDTIHLTSQSSTGFRPLAKLCLINSWVNREDQLRISDDQCLMMRQEQSHKASGQTSDLSHFIFPSQRVCACVS